MKKAGIFSDTSLFCQTKGIKKSIRYKKSEAVKYLETIANDAARKRYPNTPPKYLAPRTYRDSNTNALTNCIVDFLRLSGHHCERTGNEGRLIDNRKTVTDVLGNARMIGSVQRVHGSGMRGTSDLKAVINGRFVAIEVKCATTHDRQSEAQKDYQQAVQQAGGIYFIASSFEQFLTWYNQNFER